MENVAEMDELLAQCIALKLASSIAYALKGDAALGNRLEIKWKDMLNEGRYIDALEQHGDKLTPTYLVKSRISG